MTGLHPLPPGTPFIEPLPPDHVPETGFLQTIPGTRTEIVCEEYITGTGVNLGTICYRIDTDPDGAQYTPWDYDETEDEL